MSWTTHAAWTVLLAAAVAACEGAVSEEEALIDTRAADPVVALRSSSTLGGAASLARFGQAFRAREQSVIDIGPTAVAYLQFNVVVATLEQYYERTLGCAPDELLTTGDLTLTATFDDRCEGLVRPAGTLTASVAVEETPCDDDDGQCPSAIVWTLEAEGLSFSNPLRRFEPTFDGLLTLRSPLVDAEPMTWNTGSDFTMTFDIGSIAVESELSFFYDRQTQCLEGDLSGRLRLLEVDAALDDLDQRIGEIVVEVDDFYKCGEMCPERGDVNLIYGYGEVLRWFYDGSDEAHVIGPRGRELDVVLPCSN